MTGARSEPTLTLLERHLRDAARRYFPDLPDGELQIGFTGSREGRLSSVQRVRIEVGGAERALVVKLPPAPASGPTPSRPRVAPLLDPEIKF